MLEHPLILDTTAVEQRGILGISTHYCCALTPAASWHEERWSELARRGRFARPLSSAPHRPRRRTRLPRHPIHHQIPHTIERILSSTPTATWPSLPPPSLQRRRRPPADRPCALRWRDCCRSIRSWIRLIFLGKAEVVVFPSGSDSFDGTLVFFRGIFLPDSLVVCRFVCCFDRWIFSPKIFWQR